MNCKNSGIKPDTIFSWIIDLFSLYSPSNDSISSLNDKQKIELGREEDKKTEAFNIKRLPLIWERPNQDPTQILIIQSLILILM